MTGGGILLLRRAVADDGAARHQARAIRRQRFRDARLDGGGVVPVDADRVPACRPKARHRVGTVGKGGLAVDGDAVVVPEKQQSRQFQMPGKSDGLMTDSLHQVAVGNQGVGAVVDNSVAEAGVQHALGQGHADGVGKALSKRPGGGLDAACQTVFGMPGGLGAELAEAPQLLQRHVGEAAQVQQRVEQHGAMSGGQHKAVAIVPMRVAGVEFQKAGEQHAGDIGHAHGHSGMTAVGLLHGVDGEDAQGVRHGLVGDFRLPGGFVHCAPCPVIVRRGGRAERKLTKLTMYQAWSEAMKCREPAGIFMKCRMTPKDVTICAPSQYGFCRLREMAELAMIREFDHERRR